MSSMTCVAVIAAPPKNQAAASIRCDIDVVESDGAAVGCIHAVCKVAGGRYAAAIHGNGRSVVGGKQAVGASPLVTMELAVPVIVIVPVLFAPLDVPARMPALIPYWLLLWTDEGVPFLRDLRAEAVNLPELQTKHP